MPAFHYNRIIPGEWPMYRANPCHTGQATLAGRITRPAVRWRWFVGGNPQQVRAADVDSDGQAEVLLTFGGGLTVRRTDGTLLWQHAFPRGATLLYSADVDLDGTVELILTADTPATLYVVRGTDGTLLHERTFADFQSIQAGHKLADLDGDGRPELVWFGNKAAQNAGENGYVLSFARGADRPEVLWGGEPSRHLYNLHYRPNVVVGDLDGDGRLEVVVGSKGGDNREHARLVLAVYDGATGQLKDVERHDGHRSYGALQLVDLDGDGRLEIAETGFYYLATMYPSPEGLRQRYTRIIHDRHTVQDIAGRYDDQPRPLILIQGTGGMEYGYDHRRQVFDFNPHGQSFPYIFAIDPVAARTVWDLVGHTLAGAADVDGDGVREVFTDRDDRLTAFRRFEQTGERADAELCRVRADDPPGMNNNYYPDVGTTVIPYDIDGDGRMEVLAKRRDGHRTALVWLDGLTLDVTHTVPLDDAAAVEIIGTGDLPGEGTPQLFAADADGQVLVIDPMDGVIAQFETGGFVPTPSVARFTLDGPPRVIVARRSGHRDCLDATTLDAGVPKRCWTVGPDARPPVAPDWQVQPLIVDIDGRGEKALLLVGRDDRCLHLIDGSGRSIRQFELGPSAMDFYLLAPGHFTDRVHKDVYAGIQYPMYGRHRSRLIHGVTGETLWESIPGLAYLPAQADLRGTGLEDLVGLYYFTHVILDGRTGATLFEDATRPGYHPVSVVDADGDGQAEVICSGGYMTISCAGADGTRRWVVDSLHYNAGGAAGIGDVDGDGRLELGVAFRDGRFDCYAADTGERRWTLPLPAAGSDCVCGDVDGDGRPEFLFGCYDGQVYAVGVRDGQPAVVWTHYLGGAVGAPIIADADGDGHAEVLVAAGDGYLYCLTE
ncbi:MAG: VCBS repeat-containing protein [Candidatus Latescibacteria bacterium]|nr:VCBS repeat-containing protein [Candidatus Latescibacterota bacterium]